jgi:hypothetical protein
MVPDIDESGIGESVRRSLGGEVGKEPGGVPRPDSAMSVALARYGRRLPE